MNRRLAMIVGVLACGALSGHRAVAEPARVPQAAKARPNFIVILLDDLGFSDLHATGNPVMQTPNIDRLAAEGTHLTSMYTAPLCTPTRGELLTGRYPVHTGIVQVTGPGSPQGIRPDEVTIADALRRQGYRTAMYGKWHVGDFDTRAEWNPLKHGFDEFLGVPYSHDYDYPAGVPLYHNLEKVEQPVKFQLLTRRYTEEAVKFIKASRGRPFFVYLAHNMPHIPLGTAPEFVGHSRAGRYGDAIEELDWSVGQVMAAVRAIGADRNTLVVFQSDNGPWGAVLSLVYDRNERGDKLPGDVGWTFFRSSKGSTYEGGIRVPAFVRWPGHVPAGRATADIVATIDWLPTFVSLSGGKLDRPVDGVDQSALLQGSGGSARNELLTFNGPELQAIRQGPWKLRVGPPEVDGPMAAVIAAMAPAGQARTVEPVSELFNLDTDPSERLDIAAAHPDIVTRLRARMDALRTEFRSEQSAAVTAARGFHELSSPLD